MRDLSKILTTFVLMLVVSNAACAAVERVFIDKRSKSEPHQQWVTFAADGEEVGHAFVVWSKEDPKKRMTTQEAAGFYPGDPTKKEVKVLLGKERGSMFNDIRHRRDFELIVRVDSDAYAKSRGVFESWEKSGTKYFLGFNDCTTFAGAVAAATGLKTPTRLFYPEPINYVKALVDLDKPDRDQRNEQRARAADDREAKARQRADLAKRLADRARKLKWQQEAMMALHLSAITIDAAMGEIARYEAAIVRQERRYNRELQQANKLHDEAQQIRQRIKEDGLRLPPPG